MTEEEEQIAFNQWLEDWGNQFKGLVSKTALWQIYISMDLSNRLEFLQKARKGE